MADSRVLAPSSSGSAELSLIDTTTFGQDDWKFIIMECSSLASKWEILSTLLGLPSTLIETIRASHPSDLSCCWNEALSQWIKQNYNIKKFGEPSWQTLLRAIMCIDRSLFEKLANNHKMPQLELISVKESRKVLEPTLMKHIQHFNSFYDGQSRDICKTCSEMLEVVTKQHMIGCCDVKCPIKMCQMNQQLQHHHSTSIAKLQLAQSGTKPQRKPRRAHDFSSRFLIRGGSYTVLSRLLDSRTMESIMQSITKNADEILDRLDQEEPLLLQQPSLLTQQSEKIRGSEIKYGSTLQQQQQSEEIRGSEQHEESKLIQESELPERPQTTCIYPKQKLLHQLKPDYLTVGEDGCYYKTRDYNLNETDLLGSGGFGSCLWAQDLTTEKMFAIKQNKNVSFKSIEDECRVLSRFTDNDYIIKFLGAVIDEGELPTQPPLVCKMMMELAENGNLAEMLRDEDGLEAPLPQDQSLYYLQQILEGVNFLHQSGYLHLDIKAQNILVFDSGRTVKLTDFGTAVAVGEVTSMQGLKGLTPYFAAPEVIKGEVPRFSADIWSVLCILIEMLTARPPGCHKVGRNDVQMMFLIGMYEDHKISELISLDDLDVDSEVKQLFIDVLRKDPQSRPGAIELLNRPLISSAVEYGRYFDECYDSEDAEDLEASPAAECDDSLPIADVPQQISLTSSGGHSSLHSLGDKVGELPCGVQLQRNRGSQNSRVGGDLKNSVTRGFSGQQNMLILRDSGVSGSSQMTARSSDSGSSNQQRLLDQDSGLEDRIGVDVPLILKSSSVPNLNFSQVSSLVSDYTVVQRSYSLGRKPNTKQSTKFPLLPQDSELTNGDYILPERLWDLSVELSLQITNFEQYFSWPEYGLSLHIPENSLPEDVQQCSIFIKPRIMGEYKLPEDSHLVSAVYSIKCVPKCQFSEPVTLEIRHCAKPKNIHKLSFTRAIRSSSEQKTSFFHVVEAGESSQTQNGILYSCFPHHTSYGFVELSKFCQFGVIQRDTDERDYCVNVYYHEDNIRRYGVYFTIMWNTNTHKKVLDEYYQKVNAVFRHDQPVEFEDNKIQLDIPFPPPKGIISDDEAWKILSVTPPVIRRKEVDSFKEGKRIPSCQLLVKCDSEQLFDLEPQSVSLKGAKEPYNVFTISVSAGSSKLGKEESNIKPNHSAHTTHPSLAEMLSELRIITDPYQLGVFLDIESHVLKEIEKDHRQVSEQRRAVIEYWHRNCSECSWGALADAVDKMGDHSNLVKTLRELSKTSNTPASEQAHVASEPPVVDPQYDKLPSGSSSRSTGIERQHKISSEISFTVLIKELSNNVSDDWEDIGLFLGLQQGALDEIRSKFPSHTKKCFREMIKLWLRKIDPVPTWSAIIDAIEELDYESLAEELKDKFL